MLEWIKILFSGYADAINDFSHALCFDQPQ